MGVFGICVSGSASGFTLKSAGQVVPVGLGLKWPRYPDLDRQA